MYKKEEAAQLKQEFWTAFGQYMSPVPSAEGEKINWVNYKTGEKNIRFVLDAGHKSAQIAIELNHKDPGIQQLYFEQFVQMRGPLQEALQEEWIWALHTHDPYGKCISRIYTELHDVSVFNRSHWPRLISFFKPRLIALDAFWAVARYTFESLR